MLSFQVQAVSLCLKVARGKAYNTAESRCYMYIAIVSSVQLNIRQHTHTWRWAHGGETILSGMEIKCMRKQWIPGPFSPVFRTCLGMRLLCTWLWTLSWVILFNWPLPDLNLQEEVTICEHAVLAKNSLTPLYDACWNFMQSAILQLYSLITSQWLG